jgi:CHAT domain-containing protein
MHIRVTITARGWLPRIDRVSESGRAGELMARSGRAVASSVVVAVILLGAGIVPGAWQSSHAAEPSAESLLERGRDAFRRGALDDAVADWTEAVRRFEAGRSVDGQVLALQHLARAQSALGQYRQAARSLETALTLVETAGDAARIATIRAALGNVYIALGPPETAEGYLTSALTLARQLPDASLAAATLNDLGNLRLSQEKYADALSAYREGISLAPGPSHGLLRARARTNAAAALRHQGAAVEAKRSLDEAHDDLKAAGRTHEATFALVAVGLGYRDLRQGMPASRDQLLRQAGSVLNDAATAAAALGDRRTLSYALGHLGALYEEERRHAEALDLTRRAIVAAQQANAPESLYRWQWQAGRLLYRLSRLDDAIDAYRRSVATLQTLRPELTVAYGAATTSFRDSIGPVYFELVDLLLQRVVSLPGREQIGPYLVEARETVELFKAAELRDYFRDDCVDTALSKVTSLDVVSQSAVVIYPIVLSNRVELLVSLPGGLKSVVVPVRRDVLTAEVRQFRRKLEKRTTREYMPHARKLYDWLIRPLEPDLAAARVDTLVFVPDGALRTIPMAALHDGKQFLVTKFATAITPGLSLTDPRPIERESARVLAVGVTEAVQGFPPLPSVAGELEALRDLFGKNTTLVNEEFVIPNFEKRLREPVTIVHVASHGQFESDPDKTFLLAFDGKLTMDRLDEFIGLFKFREQPLELLTLSACDTAAGDDRAALGLAGIAIKAGARSAVATFWQVHDEAAADLVTEFYRELKKASVSRAVALQRAQLKVLGDPRFEHPGFWAPFLMINSWL